MVCEPEGGSDVLGVPENLLILILPQFLASLQSCGYLVFAEGPW